jgi:hypothetical protein
MRQVEENTGWGGQQNYRNILLQQSPSIQPRLFEFWSWTEQQL